jgi:homoserine O-acetyltransferase/O-succinyltransferase
MTFPRWPEGHRKPARAGRRFDANCYLVVSKAMDRFELGATPAHEAEALRRIQAKVLLVGITSGWLFPPSDVQALAERMRAAGVEVRYEELASSHGHDSFLADEAHLLPLLASWLNEPRRATVRVG